MRIDSNSMLSTTFLVIFSGLLTAQSMPPVAKEASEPGRFEGKYNLTDTDPCPAITRSVLPLVHLKNSCQVLNFYRTDRWLTPIQQVRFLYGFGQGARSLSADLATMIFPHGLQVSFGSTVTAAGSEDSTENLAEDMNTPTEALERLKAGGDFYVRAAYPLIAAGESKKNVFTTFAISRIGFNVSGSGDEATITQATERNFNNSLEFYGHYAALEGQGFAYAVARVGWQNVQQKFARATGLPGRNFFLGQFGVGLQFSRFLRIGFQRFYGPEQAFGVTRDVLNQSHLVLQVMPPVP